MRLTAGTRLGPYVIIAPLGAGGMGEVHRARDTKLQREVAIKVLPESLAGDADALARFEREALAVAALSHPNILAIFDFGEHDGMTYAVMELLEGQTLRDVLASGALPQRRAVDYALQVATGLSAAHEKGIVHRDLKPENLFVTKDGRVKILDFGLAKRVGPTRDVEKTAAATEAQRTEPGVVVGTLSYMSPEQVRGAAVDHRSDIFSFGTILYELLTGKKAFQRPSGAETMAAILKEETAAPSESGIRVAPILDSIVQHCLEKSPDARFQSAHDVAFALGQVGTGTAVSAVEPAPPIRSNRRVAIFAGIGAAVLLVAIAAVVLLRRMPETATTKSVAVLPFVNMSSDKENEYFSDGVAEDLITALSKISGLHVAARTSSFAFKGKNEDVREIGKLLDVGAVLEGSVAKSGDRVRITAQLIDTQNGYHLWSETYDRDLKDVFAVRSQLAQTVAEALQVRLLAGERQALEKKPTEDVEAYQLYLKGRHEIASFTPAGYENGMRYLQAAIARDPNYALAHLGVAYYYLGAVDYIPGRDALPRSRAAAEKALQLDPSLAEAHADIGWVRWLDDRDHEAARREFQIAIRMQPDLAFARQNYGWYLVAVGMTGDGLAESRRAVELDPLSSETNTIHGFNLYFARRYEEAIEQLRTAVSIDPDYGWAHEFLGRAYAKSGRPAEAIAELEIANRLASGIFAENKAPIARIHADRGEPAEARKILHALRAERENFVPSYHLAVIEAGLGEREQAIESLEKAAAEKSYWSGWINVDPDLDVLRSDPRFQAVAAKMKPRGRS